MNLWLISVGTDIDMYTHIETAEIREYDLLEIGSRSSINFHAALLPHYWESNPITKRPTLHLGRIRLAPYCYVGNRAVVPLSKVRRKSTFE